MLLATRDDVNSTSRAIWVANISRRPHQHHHKQHHQPRRPNITLSYSYLNCHRGSLSRNTHSKLQITNKKTETHAGIKCESNVICERVGRQHERRERRNIEERKRRENHDRSNPWIIPSNSWIFHRETCRHFWTNPCEPCRRRHP